MCGLKMKGLNDDRIFVFGGVNYPFKCNLSIDHLIWIVFTIVNTLIVFY